jgi:chemotaxis protein methyltransferase CheR
LPEDIRTISTEDFDAIRAIIYREAGISLNNSKKALVASRLAKRLAHLNLKNHSEYLEYLDTKDPKGIELQVMVNCLTTNKTDFFREPHHFEFLRNEVFPRIEKDAFQGKPRKIRIWSAACSTGEEPYSTAITILEHFKLPRSWDIQILASDINTEVLKTASQGIYSLERIEGIDERLKRKYFLRGTGQSAGFCQVRPEVRRMVRFHQINLMDERWPIRNRFDVIFCRNVIIYFNAQTQQCLLPRLVDRLTDRGHLMLGHSENLHWMNDLLSSLGNTIYQRKPGGHASHRKPQAGDQLESPIPRHKPVVPSVSAGFPKSHLACKAERSVSDLHAKRRARIAKAHRHEITAGEYFASRKPYVISTLLGSCIGACLFDPTTGIGGMTHFMLPCHPTNSDISARYGINAMELLINEIMKLGGDRRRLCAKVFGGANVMAQTNWPWDVGKRNIEFIRRFLRTDRIPIVAERLGGKKPMRVFFITSSGKAYVKEIHTRKAIREHELLVLEQASNAIARPPCSDITLF